MGDPSGLGFLSLPPARLHLPPVRPHVSADDPSIPHLESVASEASWSRYRSFLFAASGPAPKVVRIDARRLENGYAQIPLDQLLEHYGKYNYSRLHFNSPKQARTRTPLTKPSISFQPGSPLGRRYICARALPKVGRPRLFPSGPVERPWTRRRTRDRRFNCFIDNSVGQLRLVHYTIWLERRVRKECLFCSRLGGTFSFEATIEVRVDQKQSPVRALECVPTPFGTLECVPTARRTRA